MKPRIERLVSFLDTRAKAWAAVSLYALLLIATVDIVLGAYLWVFGILGEAWVSRALYAVFTAAGCILVWAANPRTFGTWIALALLVPPAAAGLLQLSVPADRIHALQYAPLTLLIYNAVRLHWGSPVHYLAPLPLVGVVGLVDEGVQATRPDRYFAWSDIGVDLLSALFLILLVRFVLEQRNAPGSGRMSPNPDP